MNLYFLVEGKTERIVYPKWISHLLPELTQVKAAYKAISNNFFLISGQGYPQILGETFQNAVAEINEQGNFDYLVLVIDTDDMTAEEKCREIEEIIKEQTLSLQNCQLIIVSQRICIETWFLGNKKIYPNNSQDENCLCFTSHYDVSTNDPESMEKFTGFKASNAVFHENYLRAILREKNIVYKKTKPNGVVEKYYIDELKKRVRDHPTSLRSLNALFEFFDQVSRELK